MDQPAAAPPTVVHVDDVAPIEYADGAHWGARYQPLTPALDALPGRLGMNLTRVPPGRTACPFHAHAREDEIFYVLSGRGVLRYGEALHELRAGHCIACPAGTGMAHQIANTSDDEDLVYLCIGPNDPHEVCTYPDSGKVLVRALKTVGRLQATDYMDGEHGEPRILAMARQATSASR
ncbi:MAG TPA: cupin domain-containing protein [Albitalea sp.]